MSGGGGKSTESRGGNLMPFVQQFEGETRGARSLSIDQMKEAMATGGIGARMPIIGSATTGAMNAITQALQSIRTGLNRSGLTGTPFANSQMMAARLQGAQQIAGIAPSMAMQWANQGAQTIGGTMQSVLGALAGQGASHGKHGQGGI